MENDKETKILNTINKEIKKLCGGGKSIEERARLTYLIHKELSKYFMIFDGYYDETDLETCINDTIEMLKGDGEDTKYCESVKKRIIEGDSEFMYKFKDWLHSYILETSDHYNFMDNFHDFLEHEEEEENRNKEKEQ